MIAVVALFATTAIISIAVVTKRISVVPSSRDRELVEQFFSAVFEENSNRHGIYSACDEFFNQELFDSEYGEYSSVESLYSILFGYTTREPKSYSIEFIDRGTAIVKMFDESGEPINPPVYFGFTVDMTGEQFSYWAAGRMQPFSSYSEEYSKEWGLVYD